MSLLKTVRNYASVAKARPGKTAQALLKFVPFINVAMQHKRLKEAHYSLSWREETYGIESGPARRVRRQIPTARREIAVAWAGSACALGAVAAPNPALRTGLATAALILNGSLVRRDLVHLMYTQRNFREANGDFSLSSADRSQSR